MVNQPTLQLEQAQKLESTKFQLDRSDIPNEIVASDSQDLVNEDIDDEQVTLPRCIRLNLDNLKSYETVHNQFKRLGIIFHNCLAIQPSNPAFPRHSGINLLMGSPKSGLLEVTFVRPVNWVSALVTSSQRLVIYAYDEEDKLLNESVLPTANIVNSGSDIPPNTMLSVSANYIKKVCFCAFDGHFTLDEFKFCFST
ncbi:hypothetical protein [Sphaerospermopsis aphanizomenoides]|uniref:hypothetical protein n=1 Tax=Sphaerospermopsis aphanizomenoides TaxID=459663 RepID=UPI001F2DC614|nr:hypothetical protein [Sphaerospermopsis aphanizomenoides]